MSAAVLQHLRRLLPSPRPDTPDGELLRRFVAARDESAFAELLNRHGPLVWGACRRAAGDAHAAEDAFQATFLQLARQAARLGGDGPLAGWLRTVAARLGRRARLADQRRRRREQSRPPAASADDRTWRELRQVLDAEIARLPEPYRRPIVLCYLEDLPQAEAARRLGVAPVVLRGRLERGRHKLRRRLEQLGLPSAVLLLASADAAPAALREATLRAALGGPVPPAVAALAAGSGLAARVAVVAAALLLAAGVGVAGVGRRAEPAAPPVVQPMEQGRPAADALGDPLPPGALL